MAYVFWPLEYRSGLQSSARKPMMPGLYYKATLFHLYCYSIKIIGHFPPCQIPHPLFPDRHGLRKCKASLLPLPATNISTNSRSKTRKILTPASVQAVCWSKPLPLLGRYTPSARAMYRALHPRPYRAKHLAWPDRQPACEPERRHAHYVSFNQPPSSAATAAGCGLVPRGCGCWVKATPAASGRTKPSSRSSSRCLPATVPHAAWAVSDEVMPFLADVPTRPTLADA